MLMDREDIEPENNPDMPGSQDVLLSQVENL